MEKNEMSSKINQIQNEISELKSLVDKRITTAEDKFSRFLANGMETKSLYDEGESQESSDFVHYIRTGEVKNENIMEFKSKRGSFEGGIPVSSASNNLISFNLEKLSVLRRLSKVQMISSDSFDLIVEENGGKATWGTPSAKEPFVKKYIKTYELVAEPKATSKLIEDIRIDVEQYMSEKIAQSFAIAEDEAFLLGNGIEMPNGLLNIPKGKGTESIEQLEANLTADSIIQLIGMLNSFYSGNTAFLMSHETENLIKSLKDASGRHLWLSRSGEIEQNSILGIPVFVSNFMPKPESGKVAIFYGNFEKGYKIIEKFGNYMMRDPYTERPFIKFYTSKKVGGDLVDGNAIKSLKIM
jgi:HK97 family phage major capsid protein